jgi:DNA polymerase-1
MPDDLTLQLPYIQRLCEALQVPVIREAGYEADDIIGTLGAQAERAGLEVVIVTNDKDMNQLVTDHVKILRTERTGEMKVLDARAVEEKMGVPPHQVVELLGLWGDTIDNIRRTGIGEKGAKQIIQQYGTIETQSLRSRSAKTYRGACRTTSI